VVQLEINQLKKLLTDIFLSLGVNSEEASIVVGSILEAEISGVESHGLLRIKPYVKRIENKLMNTQPNIQIVNDKDSIIIVDGDNGLGQVVAHKTLKICFERLATRNVILASVRNSNHFGMSGYFSRKAAEKGYIAIVASNASPTMAPWGGIDPLLGTNPVAMSFPVTRYDNFTLDMATSATARGRIRTFERRGEEMPVGLAIDKYGKDTTDPQAALDGGTVLPLGQHKGYGLSMFLDVLSAGLSSASLSYETESMFQANRVSNIGHFFLLIKLDGLIDSDQFKERMEEWFHILKDSEARPGFEEIMIPGEIEQRKLNQNYSTISINKKTHDEIMKLRERLL